jgi:dTDP-4-amino-4,6-dideoxygalactose transaminase
MSMIPLVKLNSNATATPETFTGLDFGDDEVLRYQRPELPPLSDVARYYALSEDARFYSNGGPCHQRLAERLAARIGGVTCVPVSNCTLGLIAAVRQLCGAPQRHRRLIALPSFTFTASACAIAMAGYEPLFVDVEADSWQMDPAALDHALATHRGRIAGVMGTSTFGTAAPSHVREGWRSACAAHGVHLVIDSAAGFGADDDAGRPLGSQGETEVFSFHATKPFAIGEGGAITTPDPELGASLTRFINFGLDPETHTSLIPGLNAKMSELHAATALAMLDRFDALLARRRGTADSLREALPSRGLTYQRGCDRSTWQVLPLLVRGAAERDRVLEVAARLRIEVRPGFDPPLHRHPAFAAASVHGTLDVTEQLAARMVCLPMANSLGPRQTTRLVGLIDEAVGR